MIGIAIIAILAAIVIVSLVSVPAVRTGLMTRAAWRERKTRGRIESIWPNLYQPLELEWAWREPLDFESFSVCPHCGNFALHPMSAPRHRPEFWQEPPTNVPRFWPYMNRKRIGMGDHPDAATKRNCSKCGHVWGEK